MASVICYAPIKYGDDYTPGERGIFLALETEEGISPEGLVATVQTAFDSLPDKLENSREYALGLAAGMPDEFKYIGDGSIHHANPKNATINVPEGDYYKNLPEDVQDALRARLEYVGEGKKTSGELVFDYSSMDFIKTPQGTSFDYRKTPVIPIPGWGKVKSLLNRLPIIDL